MCNAIAAEGILHQHCQSAISPRNKALLRLTELVDGPPKSTKTRVDVSSFLCSNLGDTSLVYSLTTRKVYKSELGWLNWISFLLSELDCHQAVRSTWPVIKSMALCCPGSLNDFHQIKKLLSTCKLYLSASFRRKFDLLLLFSLYWWRYPFATLISRHIRTPGHSDLAIQRSLRPFAKPWYRNLYLILQKIKAVIKVNLQGRDMDRRGSVLLANQVVHSPWTHAPLVKTTVEEFRGAE